MTAINRNNNNLFVYTIVCIHYIHIYSYIYIYMYVTYFRLVTFPIIFSFVPMVLAIL
jgi:hypothetical protein